MTAGAGVGGASATTIELIRPGAPAWAAVLAAASHDVYHLPGYAEVCAIEERAEARALLVDGPHGRLILPLLVREVPGGGLDAASPYGYSGPVIAGPGGPAAVAGALEAGIAWLRDQGFVSLFVRLHPLLDPEPPRELGTLVDHGETVSIDLRLPADTLWSQMRTNHRRDIARSRELGYAARVDEGWEHLATFRDLYRETMIRNAAAPHYFFEDRYFAGLRDTLGDRLRLVLVEHGREVAAAGLYAETGGIVQYHLSGVAEAHRGAQPTKLMMHFVAGWAKARDDRTLHLGGGVGGRADSLFHFKAGFSPLRHRFRTLRVVVDEAGYERLVRARDPGLDPGDRSGFFPGYRTP